MDERYFSRANEINERPSAGSRVSRLFSRESRQAQPQPPQPHDTQYSAGFSGSGGVVINSPTTYEDVQLLIDHLRVYKNKYTPYCLLNIA